MEFSRRIRAARLTGSDYTQTRDRPEAVMRKLLPLFLPLLMLCLASTAARSDAGWTDPARVVMLESNLFGRILVELDLRKNPSDCKEKRLFFRELTGESSQQMLDILVQAAANRLPVKLRVSGICHLKGYAEFNAVALVP